MPSNRKPKQKFLQRLSQDLVPICPGPNRDLRVSAATEPRAISATEIAEQDEIDTGRLHCRSIWDFLYQLPVFLRLGGTPGILGWKRTLIDAYYKRVREPWGEYEPIPIGSIESMRPTTTEDCVLMGVAIRGNEPEEIGLKIRRISIDDIRPNDVIVFRVSESTKRLQGKDKPAVWHVKRVVAVPGEQFVNRPDGTIEITNESGERFRLEGVKRLGSSGRRDDTLNLQPGEFAVLGDNPNHSIDSGFTGEPVRADQILFRVDYVHHWERQLGVWMRAVARGRTWWGKWYYYFSRSPQIGDIHPAALAPAPIFHRYPLNSP